MSRIRICAAAAGAVLASTTPASAGAAGDLLLTDTGSATAYDKRIVGHCEGGPGAALDLNHVTYAVRGVAQASSTGAALPVGTTLACWIRDRRSGAAWGPPVRGFAPGGTAAAAGTITARSTGYLTMCMEAYALFDDNRPAVHYRTPGC